MVENARRRSFDLSPVEATIFGPGFIWTTHISCINIDNTQVMSQWLSPNRIACFILDIVCD